jgi:cytoskeleton protein RodZ
VSIGETLSAARRSADMSVEQVSRLTRVRATLVRQIEDGDFSQCGGAVYARGHIRSIAHVVGIDPEPLIAEYDAQHQGALPEPSIPAPPLEPEAVRATPRGPNWGAAMAVALSVVCVWGLVTVFTGDAPARAPQPLAGPSVSPAPSAPASPCIPVRVPVAAGSDAGLGPPGPGEPAADRRRGQQLGAGHR